MSYSFYAAKTNKQFRREREGGVKGNGIKRKLYNCRDRTKEGGETEAKVVYSVSMMIMQTSICSRKKKRERKTRG